MDLSWEYLFTSKLSHPSVKPGEQPPPSMLSVHWWRCIRNKWLCSVLSQRNKTLNLVSCSVHKKLLRSHQDVQLLTDNSFLVYLCVYLFSKSQTTLILRKKMTFCKPQKIFDGWNTLCSRFQPGGAVALSCHSQNRCCKPIPCWVYFGSTAPSEETQSCFVRASICMTAARGWWRSIVCSSSSSAQVRCSSCCLEGRVSPSRAYGSRALHIHQHEQGCVPGATCPTGKVLWTHLII